MLSINDISEQAGVSIATVSRVINKNGRYSKETEERVLKIIEENHYVPNMIAKGLRMQKMKNVGIIVPDITNEFFMKLFREIEKNLFAHGFGSFLCNTDEQEDLEKAHVRMMREQNVCGLIYLSGTDYDAGHIERSLPSVYIDRLPNTSRGTQRCVTSDNVEGGYLATKELLDQGCRRILIMTSRKPVSGYRDRFEGYVRALTEAGLREDDIRAAYLDRLHYQDAYEEMNRLLDSGEFDGDGVFASSDWLAVGCYKALDEHGLRVPEDVKLVGFDDISVTAFNTVPITTVHQQVDLLGAEAVKLLFEALEEKEPLKESFCCQIPVYLVPRGSTRVK